MDIDTLIERAGGRKVVTRKLKLGDWAVAKWRTSGTIPAKHWAWFSDATGEPLETVMRAGKPERRKAA